MICYQNKEWAETEHAIMITIRENNRIIVDGSSRVEQMSTQYFSKLSKFSEM